MKSLSFYGAAGEVTGSSFLLTASTGERVLIDLGMFQGTESLETWNYEPLQFNPAELTAVLVTHAHLDHCGRLPLLIRGGYRGKLYMTAATHVLVELTLLDSAKINAEDHGDDPLYTFDDVEKLLGRIVIVEYDQSFAVGPFSVTMRDAGHILGSATIELIDTGAAGDMRRIVFSGDLGNSPEDIVRPTEIVPQADMVVMESTYGDRLHPKQNAAEIIMNEINEVERSGGVLLIPAFSVDRTQEILHKINHLKLEKKIKEETPVFLDSPMAIRATMIYEQFRNLYNKEMTNHAMSGDPFNFPGLTMTERGKESRKIEEVEGTKVIIAGNGMMMGGRILYHAAKYLPLASTRLLIVGYQGEETLGRLILEGAKQIKIKDQTLPMNATVTNASSMSAHADQNQLIDWLGQIKGVKRVYLVHGEDTSRTVLAARIRKDLHISDVRAPGMNETQNI